MPVDTKELLDAAEKLGKLVTEHAVLARYTEASKSLSSDSEATRLLADMDREIQTLTQQEQQGISPTAAQRQRIQTLQTTLAANLKVKNFTLAQYELTDLLRQVSQAWQKPIAAAQKAAGGKGVASPASKLVV